MLNLRAINEGVDQKREALFDEYTEAKHSAYRMRSMADYEELKRHVAAQRLTQSAYVRKNLMANLPERSNGESALAYFTDTIREDALYLLDEPENSLSAERQLELQEYLVNSARFYRCQFILSTHSPFLLAMRGAKVYDLDADPVCVRPWTQIASVRTYRDFFREHDAEF